MIEAIAITVITRRAINRLKNALRFCFMASWGSFHDSFGRRRSTIRPSTLISPVAKNPNMIRIVKCSNGMATTIKRGIATIISPNNDKMLLWMSLPGPDLLEVSV